MQLFKKLKRNGWAALKVSDGYISLVHVERRYGALPAITVWRSLNVDINSYKVLKSLTKKYRLNDYRCIAVLNRSDYQVLQVKAIEVPLSESKQAARWSIRDMLDYPIDNAAIDVLPIPFANAHPARPRFMLVIAAHTEIIQRCIRHFRGAASRALKVIDIAETGQRNIAALLEQPNRGLALLSFNDEGGLLTFTAAGELYRSRHLYVTTEQLKTKDEDRLSAVHEHVALDIQRTLDGFERRFPYVAITQLLVAPCEMRAGLVDLLRTYLSVEVNTFELSDIFDLEAVPNLVDVGMQARAFTLLGSALREGHS